MTLPNTGITSTMVGDKIGSESRKWSVLCTHSNINKWSKWKPVISNKATSLIEQDFQNVDYGLVAPDPTTDFKSTVNNNWIYEKPINFPHRIGDFRNYNHDAPAPMGIESDFVIKEGQVSKIFSVALTVGDNPYYISLDDFKSGFRTDIGNYYYGIVFVNGATEVYQTATENIANGGNDLVVNLNHAVFKSTGTKAYHLLCDIKATSLTNVSGAGVGLLKFLPVPTKDNSNNVSTITIKPALAMKLNIVGISTQKQPTFWSPPSNYSGIGGSHFKTLGMVYLLIELENPEETGSQYFHTAGLEMGANPTYFGVNTNKFAAKLYNMQGDEVSEIEVPSDKEDTGGGSSPILKKTRCIVGVEQGILNRDGRTAIQDIPMNLRGQEILTTISIYKSGGRINSVAFNAKAEA